MSIREVGGVPFLPPEREPPRSGTTAEEAARSFESFYCEMLFKEMEKTLPKGFLGDGPMSALSTLVDRALADAMAAGGGIGVGRLLSGQLDPAAVHTPSGPDAPTPLKALRRFPVDGRVTSGFGMRIHPILGGWRMHRGVDIAAETGTPIVPVAPGTVKETREQDGYGRMVVVDHGNGWTSLYAHCDRVDVVEGQRVDAGTRLGTVGSTGLSTGPHLHLEVHRDGKPVDPASLLEASGVAGGQDSLEKILRGS